MGGGGDAACECSFHHLIIFFRRVGSRRADSSWRKRRFEVKNGLLKYFKRGGLRHSEVLKGERTVAVALCEGEPPTHSTRISCRGLQNLIAHGCINKNCIAPDVARAVHKLKKRVCF